MFDPDLVRYLCRKLAVENDPQRFNELLSTLHAVVSSDSEDTRLRMAYLVKHYPGLLEELPDEARDAA
jgi:hypothetical protein